MILRCFCTCTPTVLIALILKVEEGNLCVKIERVCAYDPSLYVK
jgi:hypothetical protein